MSEDKNIEIRDLIDFYKRWPQLKKHLIELENAEDISLNTKETLKWLIKLADRVGKSDIGIK